MSARFTALVTGFPEPEYEFSLNGKVIFPTDRIHMTRERSGLIRLSMAFVEESDIGVYGLRVWNQHGKFGYSIVFWLSGSQTKAQNKKSLLRLYSIC
jgi:hypothetical protein